MKIVILGAGTVGTSVAQLLERRRHDVTVVDISDEKLRRVEELLDVRTVLGSASDAITLFQAGATSADLCLAVTSGDELNLVGASLARSMGTRRVVARMFNPAYLDVSTFDYRRHFQVDRLLSLEQLTALEMAKAVRSPGLFAVESFARGGVEVHEIAVEKHSKAIGVPLRELGLPREVRIGLIANERGTYIPTADDMLSEGDHVTLLGEPEHLEKVKRLFEHRQPQKRNVIIAGGGEVGYRLARLLERGRFNVVIMESDAARSRYLSERLPKTTILNCDATLRAEMEEARVGKADLYVAATGRDADNIVCGLEAKELGCGHVLCVVRRPDYANVLQRTGIDTAVSPREVVEQVVLGYIDAGPIISRTPLAGGEAEVWEIEILENAPITSAPLKEKQLPGCLIAAVIVEDYVRVAGADDRLEVGETAVVLVQRGRFDDTLEEFQPSNGRAES